MNEGATSDQPLSSRFGLHLVSLGVLLYATGPVLARSAETGGVLLSFWRLWFGVGVFGVAVATQRALGHSIGSKRGFRLATLAGALFSLNQVLFFSAIQRTSVVDATLMSTLSPIVVALLAIRVFGEFPGARYRWFSLVAIAGAIFIVVGASSGPDGDPIGMAMAFGSTVLFACFFVVSKVSRSEISVVGFLATAITTAACFVSVYVVILGLAPSSVKGPDLLRALAMATIPGAVGHIAMTLPLNYLPANVPPLFRLAGPLISGVLAWLFLAEGISWVHLVGGAVIVFGQAGAILSKAGQDLLRDARVEAAPAQRTAP